MYRLGERKHVRRRMYIWLGGLLGLLAVGAIIGVRMLHADTVIGNTPNVVTRTISYDAPKVQVFEGKTFQITLPSTWKAMPVDDTPIPTYTWHGTGTADNARWLDVYVDVSLADFSLNRVISVESNGPGLSVTSDTSDNCTSFTGGTSAGPTQTHVQAKWQGVPFLCETGNYSRDVVGIVSGDGLNDVTVTGPLSGVHHYMFVYTDNSASPDYKIFSEALKSFMAK